MIGGLRGSVGGDFLAVNRNLVGRFDPEPDLITVDLHDRHHDILTDDDFLTELPAENQHDSLSLRCCEPVVKSICDGPTRPLLEHPSCQTQEDLFAIF